MQFETRIKAALPRVNCPQCGIKTTTAPWAEKHSRFTLMYEAFAIAVLQACGNIKQAADLLRLNWKSLEEIMSQAVMRGLSRRGSEVIHQVGVDEKSLAKGHSYVSVMTDISGGRVLEVIEDRTTESAEKLWEKLTAKQRECVESVSQDMWPAYATAAAKYAPQAAIVYDKFHVSKHLNEAVDLVRRQEHKALQEEGESPLTGSKQLWLFNEENIQEEQKDRFEKLKQSNLKTGRAWAMKEQFREFWKQPTVGRAKTFFKKWQQWAVKSGLRPMKQKALMLERHLKGLLNYIVHPVTNASSEGFNSKIQEIKSRARGFRDFASYRTRILFYCGKLDLSPKMLTH
jgi:transposase